LLPVKAINAFNAKFEDLPEISLDYTFEET